MKKMILLGAVVASLVCMGAPNSAEAGQWGRNRGFGLSVNIGGPGYYGYGGRGFRGYRGYGYRGFGYRGFYGPRFGGYYAPYRYRPYVGGYYHAAPRYYGYGYGYGSGCYY